MPAHPIEAYGSQPPHAPAEPAGPSAAYAALARLSNREILARMLERDRLLAALDLANARLRALGAEPVRVADVPVGEVS